MPIDTDLSAAPYNDDTDPSKQYERVLFKPSVVVQARELNQLQRLLQDQIERFGDSIYKRGTIVDGCNFSFFPNYPYVKLRDVDATGLEVIPSSLVGLYATSASGVRAYVTDHTDGFEASSPALKTLYLHYNNAGTDGNTFQFSPGDSLTITDANLSVFSVTVENGGVGFSNADFAVFTPALAVNVTSGGFSPGDYVTQPSTGANLQVLTVNATYLANIGQVVLALKPRATDLSNASANGQQWSVANNDSIRNSGNTAVGTVTAVFGTGAAGVVVTDGSGRVLQVPVESGGRGYVMAPTATLRSANNASVATVNVTALVYKSIVTVSNTVGSVGNGYGFGVSNGVLYHKGYFLRVESQTVVVSAYSETPDNVAVGFITLESIVDSDQDTTLLDNATGSENYTAPGADRLKLTPTLRVGASSDLDFALVTWSAGNPFLQNQGSSYSRIGDEMARRTMDAQGNFVTDRFQVTTTSPPTRAREANTVQVVVDPGLAYIDGYRVQTQTNYSFGIDKGVDSAWSNSKSVSLNYGNWVRVNELGGVFQFSTGDTVTLYDTARQFMTNVAASSVGNVSPLGSSLGTARARSLVLESGTAGTPGAAYQLYLFDVAMNAGANFKNVRAVSYGGTYPGVADVVTQLDPATATQACFMQDPTNDRLLFPIVDSLADANNVVYQFRTIDQGLTFANTGLLSKTLTDSSQTYAVRGQPLTHAQLANFLVVPTGGPLQFTANVTGTVTANASTNNLIGATTTFITDLVAGDYVYVYANSTVNDVRRVTSVVNNSCVALDSVCAFTQAGVACYRYFPKNVPLPLTRTGITANTDGTGQVLTVDMGSALTGSTSINAAAVCDVLVTGAAPAAKTATRSRFVMVCTSNNAGGTAGPWCVGVPDAIRLRAVYSGANSGLTDSNGTDVTGEFYLDHRQNQSWLDLGYLYKRPGSGLATPAYMLVQFDYLTTSDTGYRDALSYCSSNQAARTGVDSTPLANLTTSISSLEVPEVFEGGYADLLGALDFRPIAANTVAPSTAANTAPLNPSSTLSFGDTANTANDRKFPTPGSLLTLDMRPYQGRTDSVLVGEDSAIFALRGPASADPRLRKPPIQPRGCMVVNQLAIPPYPNLPVTMSNFQAEIVKTRMANQNQPGVTRALRKTVGALFSDAQLEAAQPRVYTEADVGNLDRRIAQLEYYTSLSLLESRVMNKTMPSSSNPAAQRYVFGFFADDFSTAVSQATSDPSYAAQVRGGLMTPPTMNWTVAHGTGAAATQPYVDWPVVTQRTATIEPSAVQDTAARVLETNTYSWYLSQMAPAGVTADGFAFTGGTHGTVLANQDIVLSNVDRVTFGEVPGVATLYFYAPPSSPIETYDPVNIQVYQQNVLVADVGVSAVAVTTSDDIPFLLSQGGPQGGQWFAGPVHGAAGQSTVQLLTPLGIGPALPVSGFITVSGAGKISWNHDPAAGAEYTIVSNLLQIADSYRWALYYPSGTIEVAATETLAQAMGSYSAGMLPSPPVMTLELQASNPTITTGTMVVDQTIDATYQGTHNTLSYRGYYTVVGVGAAGQKVNGAEPSSTASLRGQSFDVVAWGLKPGARHAFTVAGIDKSARVRPVGLALGDAIYSDAGGMARFTYYYDAAVDQDVTSVLLSTTGPITISPSTLVSQVTSDGALLFQLTAPDSLASYKMQVYDVDVPVQLLKNAGA